MLFPTVEFGIFFILVFTVSWALNKQIFVRKIFLIAASYFFYGMWNWKFAFLLFFCSFSNYFIGLLMEGSVKEGSRKFWLVFSIVLNLGILFFFKYYGFFTQALNNLMLFYQSDRLFSIMEVVLPVGISFFTFQAMSYVIDVYRREITGTKSFIDVLLYVSFFPQLVAGPIVRAKDFIPQLTKRPDSRKIEASPAIRRILFGLVKKMIIANYIATELVDPVFLSPSAFSSLEVLLAGYGYAIQIFCDFSAYSDIAIGAASLLGYHFPENFIQPYRADSLKDFWRRWHISLSSWLRDYLYIPLGGSRKGTFRTYFNLFLTMLLGGLWHGAGWNFVLWGALHGSFLAGERFFASLGKDKRKNRQIFIWVRRFFVFNFVCFCWIFFRSPNMTIAAEYFKALVSGGVSLGIITPFVLLLLVVGILLHYIPKGIPQRISLIFSRFPVVVQGMIVAGFLLMLQVLSPEGVAPFIYFQF